ncbi:MAG: ferritin-like domain-containing protein [Candidatus Hodarchaeales archaeon]
MTEDDEDEDDLSNLVILAIEYEMEAIVTYKLIAESLDRDPTYGPFVKDLRDAINDEMHHVEELFKVLKGCQSSVPGMMNLNIDMTQNLFLLARDLEEKSIALYQQILETLEEDQVGLRVLIEEIIREEFNHLLNFNIASRP